MTSRTVFQMPVYTTNRELRQGNVNIKFLYHAKPTRKESQVPLIKYEQTHITMHHIPANQPWQNAKLPLPSPFRSPFQLFHQPTTNERKKAKFWSFERNFLPAHTSISLLSGIGNSVDGWLHLAEKTWWISYHLLRYVSSSSLTKNWRYPDAETRSNLWS